jgi:hypothetical protein
MRGNTIFHSLVLTFPNREHTRRLPNLSLIFIYGGGWVQGSKEQSPDPDWPLFPGLFFVV